MKRLVSFPTTLVMEPAMSSIQSALFSRDSELGDAKSIFLTRNCIIAPKYSEVEPMHRTRWEDLLKFGQTGVRVFADAMRRAQDGDGPARRLEREHGNNVILLFCLQQAQALAMSFEDFRPEQGFDIDLTIVVGDLFDHTKIMVYCETFPRSTNGRMVTDFASSIVQCFPLRITKEEMGSSGVIVEPVLGLLRGEGGTRGEAVPGAAQRVTQWFCRSKGVWSVTGDFLINFFLNRALISVVVQGGETIRSGSVFRSFDDKSSDAKVTTTRLV